MSERRAKIIITCVLQNCMSIFIFLVLQLQNRKSLTFRIEGPNIVAQCLIANKRVLLFELLMLRDEISTLTLSSQDIIMLNKNDIKDFNTFHMYRLVFNVFETIVDDRWQYHETMQSSDYGEMLQQNYCYNTNVNVSSLYSLGRIIQFSRPLAPPGFVFN
jgi:hypothetical protein